VNPPSGCNFHPRCWLRNHLGGSQRLLLRVGWWRPLGAVAGLTARVAGAHRPGIGWRAYFGTGDPSSEHTNHVHLSIL
jgi:hypothetical protein